MRGIYLDNNATTLLRPAYRERAIELLESPLGNPASPHSWGDNGSRVLAKCRSLLSDFLSAEENRFIFTSGGSEANTQILRSFAHSRTGQVKYISTAIEHSSVLQALYRLRAEGHEVVFLPVDSQGLVNPDRLEQELGAGKPTLVSIQWANNETGVIQDLPMLLGLSHSSGAFFHTDAAQAVGKLPVNLDQVPVDYLSLTGHKLHAPAGVGVVYARNPATLRPLIDGGEQEGGLRPGTPNTFGIGMLAVAIEDRMNHFSEHTWYLQALRNMFEKTLLAAMPELEVNGAREERICNTTNLRFPGVDGSVLIAQFDQEGIICSQASACTSRTPEPSHVLTAMGLSEQDAWSSVRFSFSVDNTEKDAVEAASKILEVTTRIKEHEYALS